MSIFLQVAQIASTLPLNDQTERAPDGAYWSNLFENLAYGITPYGIVLDTDAHTLTTHIKSVAHTCAFDNVDAKQCYRTVYEFLYTVAQIRSNRQHVLQNQMLANAYMNQTTAWLDIKKKYIKELLLYNYVIELTHKYRLAKYQMRLLMSNIMLWFQFKLLTKYDVEYDAVRCRIRHIKDLFITKTGQVRLNRSLDDILPVTTRG